MTNITNSSNIDLGTFQVPDKWNAREHRLHFNFSHVSFYYIRSSRKCWERSQEGAYTCWDVAADISLSLFIYKVIRKGWYFRNEPIATESISCTLGLTQLFLIVDYIFKTLYSPIQKLNIFNRLGSALKSHLMKVTLYRRCQTL